MKRVKYSNGSLHIQKNYGSVSLLNQGKNIHWEGTAKGKKGTSVSVRGTGKKAQEVGLKHTKKLKRGATVTGEVTVPTKRNRGKPRYGLTISKRF